MPALEGDFVGFVEEDESSWIVLFSINHYTRLMFVLYDFSLKSVPKVSIIMQHIRTIKYTRTLYTLLIIFKNWLTLHSYIYIFIHLKTSVLMKDLFHNILIYMENLFFGQLFLIPILGLIFGAILYIFVPLHQILAHCTPWRSSPSWFSSLCSFFLNKYDWNWNTWNVLLLSCIAWMIANVESMKIIYTILYMV